MPAEYIVQLAMVISGLNFRRNVSEDLSTDGRGKHAWLRVTCPAFKEDHDRRHCDINASSGSIPLRIPIMLNLAR